MKNILAIIISLSLVFTAFAEKNISIPTHAGKKVMEKWKADGSTLKSARKNASLKYFVVFTAPIDNKMLVSFQDAGIQIVGSTGKINSQFVYTIILPMETEPAIKLLQTQSTFWNIEPVLPGDKIEKNTSKKVTQHKATGELLDLLVFLEDQFDDNFINEVKKYAIKMLKYTEGYNCYRISIVPQNVEVIASLDYVREIVDYREKLFTMQDARELTNVNALQGASITKTHPPTAALLNGVQHTGDSIRICINESGSNKHTDFYEVNQFGDTVIRTPDTTSWGLRDHGTHVAGIAAGNGWRSHLTHFITADTIHWRGVAPKAMVIPGGDSGDVNNHSFTEGWFGESYYIWRSRSYDDMLSNHTLLILQQERYLNGFKI